MLGCGTSFGVPRIGADVVWEIDLEHPSITTFNELGLKWYGFPSIANQGMTIGGIVLAWWHLTRMIKAPGSPMHVLLSDQVAEHIPGCNMAAWREALEEVGLVRLDAEVVELDLGLRPGERRRALEQGLGSTRSHVPQSHTSASAAFCGRVRTASTTWRSASSRRIAASVTAPTAVPSQLPR